MQHLAFAAAGAGAGSVAAGSVAASAGAAALGVGGRAAPGAPGGDEPWMGFRMINGIEWFRMINKEI